MSLSSNNNTKNTVILDRKFSGLGSALMLVKRG